MKILYLNKIKQILEKIDPLPAIEQGFIQYSEGKVTVPPVGELLMEKGDVHIKYGCVKNDAYYTIKIASGFYDNASLGLSSSNGLMMLFSQKTGQPVCILFDEGYLTEIRTAIAGSIAAKYLAPKDITAIGIIGTGIQARLQAQYLKDVTPCRKIIVWGRNPKNMASYKQDMQGHGFEVITTNSIQDVSQQANLIVTTTPSEMALIQEEDIRPGTHITAIGSDTADKQELATKLLSKADVVVADSISQCQHRGEIYQALKNNHLEQNKVIELGNVIASGKGRNNDQEITIADLTGVSVQDIKIAEAVFGSSL